MTDEPVPVPTPPTCCATWVRSPGVEPSACQRPVRWTITGEDFGGEVLYSGRSCDVALHQAQVKQAAWQEYNVSCVKLRRLV